MRIAVISDMHGNDLAFDAEDAIAQYQASIRNQKSPAKRGALLCLKD